MRAIGIDFISALGLPPVEFVRLAADLGCQHISIAPAPFTANPHHYPLWSLRDDPVLRLDLIRALDDRNITISLGEGFLLRPGVDITTAAPDIELMRELGAPLVNIVSLEPNPSRAIDQLGIFAGLAESSGMKATLEMMPGLPLGTLDSAAAAISKVGDPTLGLLLDSMHVFRSGATVADIENLDPAIIFYAQLCDVPFVSKYASYGEEARDNRLPPGQGELPLRDFIAALPPHLMLGLEVPMLEAAQSGIGPRERLAPCVAALRALLA